MTPLLIGQWIASAVIVAAFLAPIYLVFVREDRLKADEARRIKQAERDVADATRKRFERKLGWKDAA